MSTFKLGYNTNGLAHHRWQDALPLIAELGYRSVALTVDQNCLDPFSPNLASELEEMRALLDQLQLSSVIETGARFLLNPAQKHEPTLMSSTAEERTIRIDFLKRCVDIAAELQSEAVSFWSGILSEEISFDNGLTRLTQGCSEVSDYANTKNVKLAFEPEPGMFIESMDQFSQLKDNIPADHFGLTLDVGHVHCLGDGEIANQIKDWSHLLFNVHIEDMQQGIHEHLRFGEGEINFLPVISALQEIEYAGCVNVELSRHSHMAPQAMQESIAFLQKIVQQVSLIK